MSNDWPPLIPLSWHADVPPFPTDALPTKVKNFVEEVAEAYQVPADLPGALVLAVGGATIAKRLHVMPNEGWNEPGNIFVAVAMPPASRKSPVFRNVTQPLIDIEKNEAKRLTPEIREAETQRICIESALKKAEKEAIHASIDGDLNAFKKVEELRAQLPEIPKPPRLLADDVTPEKLISLLAENESRIAVMSAEGGVFDLMGGRYSNNVPNLDVYLKGHAGDMIRVDRIGRPADFVDDPALTIGVTLQPDILRGIASKPGLAARGLLARFLYAIPPSLVGTRRIDTIPVRRGTYLGYHNLIQTLFHAVQNNEHPRNVVFSPEARTLFRGFQLEVETSLGEGGELEFARDWGGKLCGAVARLALILHTFSYPENPTSTPIAPETLQTAIHLGNYFKAHALTVLDLMGTDEALNGAKAVLDWIVRQGLTEFSERDAHQALRGRFKRKAELTPALAALIERGYLLRIPAPRKSGAGRNASPTYMTNPSAAQNTQITQNYSAVSSF